MTRRSFSSNGLLPLHYAGGRHKFRVRWRTTAPVALLFAFLPAIHSSGCARPAVEAELLLENGRIYTASSGRPWAESVAIAGDRILFAGSAEDAQSFAGAGTRRIDLGGRFVLPGFHDRHTHPVGGGVELLRCNLNESADRAEVLHRIAACAANLGERTWLLGGGWDLTLFPAGVADRRDLDAILADRPIALDSADGHSVWVNTKALELAGIDRTTADPVGGRIERDASGFPIGTLRESAAELLSSHLPETTDAERLAGLRQAAARIHEFGIVSLTEANAGPQVIAAYDALDRDEGLGFRAVISQQLGPEEGVAGLPGLMTRRAAAHAPHVRVSAVKLFADGVIEGGTAALLAPYIGRPGSGIPNWSTEALRDVVVALDRGQFQIHIHAIGDRAIRDSLDALAAARTANGVRDARPLLAHIQLFDPADIPRLKELGVIADFQPLWAFADSYITDLTEPFLGPERSRWLYPIHSVAATGAALAAGSDWSVSSMNPLEAIEVALTRCDYDLDTCDKPWIPEERVDLSTMIHAYTLGGAYAGFEENESGSLETGKKADLIVLDKNLFEIPPGQISNAKVLLTLFEGKPTFGDWKQFEKE